MKLCKNEQREFPQNDCFITKKKLFVSLIIDSLCDINRSNLSVKNIMS